MTPALLVERGFEALRHSAASSSLGLQRGQSAPAPPQVQACSPSPVYRGGRVSIKPQGAAASNLRPPESRKAPARPFLVELAGFQEMAFDVLPVAPD
jgi:hypothetical protein